MNEDRWYVVDVYSRSYYAGKGFPSHHDAMVAARAIPRERRPFGVAVVLIPGVPQKANGLDDADYTPLTIYRPIQDM